jgi:hypothetical protein
VKGKRQAGLQYAIQMTALEIKKTVLNNLIIRGETAKAMELFYADNVIMQENEDEPRVGKAVCVEHERLVLKNVKEVNFRQRKW